MPDLPDISQDPNIPLPDVPPDSSMVPFRIGRKEPGGEYQYTTGYGPRARPPIQPPGGGGVGMPDMSAVVAGAFQNLPVDQAFQAIAIAERYQAMRGYQSDLQRGESPVKAFSKWGPMLFKTGTGMPEALKLGTPAPLSQRDALMYGLNQQKMAQAQAAAKARADLEQQKLNAPRVISTPNGVYRVHPTGEAEQLTKPKPTTEKKATVTVSPDPNDPEVKVTGPSNHPDVIEALKRRAAALEAQKPPPPQPGLLERAKNLLVGTPAAQQPMAPKPVTTKEEYDALPSGTIYTGKDGKKYKKP